MWALEPLHSSSRPIGPTNGRAQIRQLEEIKLTEQEMISPSWSSTSTNKTNIE